MKKLFLLILLVSAFYGCEKKFDTSLEPTTSVYQVFQIATFDSFTHTLSDSIINPSIEFTPTSDIKRVWIEIHSPESEKLSPGTIALYDNGSAATGDVVKGDNIFSALVTMKSEYINGTYLISYFIEDKTGAVKKVASQTFVFDNGKANVAPVILSVSMPDTVEVPSAIAFIIEASVSDSNGIKDIKEVYFTTVRPDQTSSGLRTSLYDDGNYTENGDASSGDGICSRVVRIDSANQKGTYRFDFEARDRGGLVSPVVRKYILVK